LTVAIYPGSFDPITNGHIDIATRAARLFERLIIGVYETPSKHLLFTTEERVELAEKAVAHLPNIEVQSFNGLTVDFARKVKAQTMVRGLRMSADFCLMSSLKYQFLSSGLLKEAASLGGNVDDLVPRPVAEALKKKAAELQTEIKEMIPQE
jgi:pantetheine-phosphate adenylyltransferase